MVPGLNLPIRVLGEPAVFWGSREREWQVALRRAVRGTLSHPYLAFTVSSFRRHGNLFDLDNLAKVVVDEIAPAAESIWATMAEGEEPGVLIDERPPPPPPASATQIYISRPPTESLAQSAPLPELLDVLPMGEEEPLGTALDFESDQIPIHALGFEGATKAAFDALGPFLGSYWAGPKDYRIRDLRVTKRGNPGSSGLLLSIWLLES